MKLTNFIDKCLIGTHQQIIHRIIIITVFRDAISQHQTQCLPLFARKIICQHRCQFLL